MKIAPDLILHPHKNFECASYEKNFIPFHLSSRQRNLCAITTRTGGGSKRGVKILVDASRRFSIFHPRLFSSLFALVEPRFDQRGWYSPPGDECARWEFVVHPPPLSSPFSLDCLISRGQSVESFARLSPAGTRWLKMFLAIWRINWNCRWQRRSCFSKTYNIPPPRFPRNSSAIRYPRTFPFLPPLSPLSPCYFYARKKTSKYNCGNWGKLRINSTSSCFFLLVMNSVVENVFFRACCYLFLIWVIIDICVFVTYCYMLRRYILNTLEYFVKKS